MATVNEVVNWAKGLANSGQGVDFDGRFGTQCMDLPVYIVNWTSRQRLWGDAIDALNYAKALGLKVTYNAPGVNPKRGDIFVKRESHPYGHIGLVIEDSDGYTIKTIEQNYGASANLVTGGPAVYVTRNFDNVIGWFTPKYGQSPSNSVSTGARKLKDERGTMTVTVNVLNVRDKPGIGGKIVATYKRGMQFNYDSVFEADGYIWVSYVSRTGIRRYASAGLSRNGVNITPYGTFK